MLTGGQNGTSELFLVFAGAYLKVEGASAGSMVGFWNWLGFVVPLTLGSVLWGKVLEVVVT